MLLVVTRSLGRRQVVKAPFVEQSQLLAVGTRCAWEDEGQACLLASKIRREMIDIDSSPAGPTALWTAPASLQRRAIPAVGGGGAVAAGTADGSSF